ncbi:MAG: hypothetical protein CSB34_02420 [Desulfobulbus propionicus]|nr:MAG: hypothetical protein CSB34_02420 [Desulfobulbus propionicus]
MEKTPPHNTDVHHAHVNVPAQEEATGITSKAVVDWNVTTTQPTFVIEDSFFRSRTPKPVHWSIAWSDVMMTMFILFLTLFIYQLANREFLNPESVEVIAGTVISTPPLSQQGAVFFHPISPQISKQQTRPFRSVERVAEKTIAKEPREEEIPASVHPIEKSTQPVVGASKEGEEPLPLAPKKHGKGIIITRDMVVEKSILPSEGQLQVMPEQVPATSPEEIITEIYDLSQTTLAEEKLEKFASVELIPDKTMRIILTGDLLFSSGQAELSLASQNSLRKLSAVIAQTPYMINVVGHTDSIPMHSEQYPTNWELSVARASRVARFLIEDMGISGTQIVVSGFSYFRPIKRNSNEQNRKANRRVEIILSKELPPVAPQASRTQLMQ